MVNNVEKVTKRHVLLVVRWPVGGIRTFFRYVYSRFDPALWRFSLLLPEHAEGGVMADDLFGQDVKFIFTTSHPDSYEFIRAIFRQLKSETYDCVHSHGFTSAICSTAPCVLLRKKHLITSHDVLNKEQFYSLKGGIKKKLLNFSLKRAQIVHSVSNDAQDNLLSFFPKLSREKCIVIRNGIEVDRFLNAEAKNFRKSDENTFLIGFFGRFMAQKGFRYLVDAIEILAKDTSLPKKPLVLAFGSGGFIDREKRDIESRGLLHLFQFMPFESNIASAIKGVDVVAMPSLWEACGLLAMETLTAGTALIATSCLGLREVTSGSPAIQVPAKDGAGIAAAIKGLMSKTDANDAFLDYQGTAYQKYDVNRQYQGILGLYDKLLGKK